MTNVALVKQGTGRYLFQCPDAVACTKGDIVLCQTRRGLTSGECLADSAMVNDAALEMLCISNGAHVPLAPIVGRYDLERFDTIDQPINIDHIVFADDQNVRG